MLNVNSKKLFWKSASIVFLVFFCLLISGKAEAANLFFSPAFGNFYAGDTFKVSVFVDTQNTAINSVETNINFPKEFLDVVSIRKTGSAFSLWIQDPTFSNADGTISFTGGLPTPGYNGSEGKIIEITFRAKAEGVAKINYSASAVRANDGLGTNVLQSIGEGEYTLIVKPTVPEIVPTTGITSPAVLIPVISSITHPDSNKWYSNKNPKFAWTYPNEFNAVRISYDQNQQATPEIFYASKITEKEFTNVTDGIYYLHVEVRDKNGWSKVSNFKFQIDTERPLNFTITELNKGDTTKTQTEFRFDAKDELSGLDHFEISIDDSAPEIISDVVAQYYKTPVLTPGKHIIFVKAYDKAGNFISSSAMFYTNLSALSTTTEKIIGDITGFIQKIYNGIASLIKDLAKSFSNLANSPTGSMIVKAIAIIGLIIPALILLVSTSFFDIWLMIMRLSWSFLSSIGLRKKKYSWGTVYDSVTKAPLYLVYVSLIDLETGREVTNSITDLYGRYGFFVLPGRYGIETRKKGYISPSMIMKGKVLDEVHSDLYFSEEISIKSETQIVTKNIPMDSLSLDWNKFVSERTNLGKEKIIKAISKVLFISGAFASIIAVVFTPVPYNLAILTIYLLVCINKLIFKEPKFGMLVEGSTNIPLSYAIVKIYRSDENTPIIKKVADKFGAYFTEVPNGRYYLTVDKKNNDGSYAEVLHTADIDIRNGIINFDIKVSLS